MDTPPSFLTKTRSTLSRAYKNTYAFINQKVVQNRTLVDVSTKFIEGLAEFAIYKQPISILGGAFSALKEISGEKYRPRDFFSSINGWQRLEHKGTNIGHLFIPILERYPHQDLQFSSWDINSCFLVQLPIGQIGAVVLDKREFGNACDIFYQPEEINPEALRKFLIDRLIEHLDTKCFSIVEAGEKGYYGSTISLVAEELQAIPSKRADQYITYLKECLEQGITRSLLFYGVPGSGKSSIARSILKGLNFRTLKFRYAENYDFTIFKFIIKNFAIQAVYIDDFDAIDHPIALLEFLEFLKKEVQVVILVANTLSQMPPALLRPDRVDQIIKIDTLEIATVKELMGKSLYKSYGSQINKWPVAYIQEFIRRHQIGKETMTNVLKELDDRVAKQRKELKHKVAA
jgi:ATPase family associated with various cellular activities (AAA)